MIDKLVKAVRILLGIVLFGLAVMTIPRGLFMVLFGVALAMLSALCLYPFLIAPVASRFGNLFFPADAGTYKEEFSLIRGMIARQEYAEAERELRALLKKRPDLIDAALMLANMLSDDLGRHDEALEIARRTLAGGKWRPEHEQLVTLAVDILLDRGEKQQAVDLLRKQSKRAGRDGAAARMAERLQYLGE